MSKPNYMLLDVQYVKANKKENHTDYLYVNYKD